MSLHGVKPRAAGSEKLHIALAPRFSSKRETAHSSSHKSRFILFSLGSQLLIALVFCLSDPGRFSCLFP